MTYYCSPAITEMMMYSNLAPCLLSAHVLGVVIGRDNSIQWMSCQDHRCCSSII